MVRSRGPRTLPGLFFLVVIAAVAADLAWRGCAPKRLQSEFGSEFDRNTGIEGAGK